MGIYLNWSTPDGQDAAKFGKADMLRRQHDALDFSGDYRDIPRDYVMVAVLESGSHDAALLVVDEQEYRQTIEPADTRRIRHLILERKELHRFWPDTARTFTDRQKEVA